MWRYRALLPVPDTYEPQTPAGFTPLMKAPRLGARIWRFQSLHQERRVCLPTLSFKDRVVAVALANAQAFGFDTVGCSSTGNLANAVAAQAARLGSRPSFWFPRIWSRPRFSTPRSTAPRLVRIDGNYDHVQPSLLADCRPLQLGICERESAPLLCGGSKTVGL